MVKEYKLKPNSALLCSSNMTCKYPHSLRRYVTKNTEKIKNILGKLDIDFTVEDSTVHIETTPTCADPAVFLYASDFIKMICRGVPLKSAKMVLSDKYYCEIVNLKKFAKGSDKVTKRRKLIQGKSSQHLQAIEDNTNCKIFCYLSSVCIIGKYKDLQKAKDIVVETANNIHPYYSFVKLQKKDELAKKEDMKDKNWAKYIPKPQNIDNRRKKSK
eukprot:GAHX01001814.1.p1 GENE.GAHX01001814.1~~GAHX01001814.1.p1  ORF type:complete len:215 (+),score=29.68 GAHX01001814.1:54-698(+)